MNRNDSRVALAGLLVCSVVLLAARWFAASKVGFGDSEALYATYALHPQPAYLDHPGLIGLVARVIGRGGAPGPESAHRVTSVVALLLPWLVALAARAAGGSWRRSLVAGIALAATPEIGVGLFAMTPDLPLALTWVGALALAAWGFGASPGSARASASFVFAGLLGGVACVSKASGALLVLALVATYATRPARLHARTIWPWAGLAMGGLVVLPVVTFEARQGFPMFRHRLIETQADAGLSLRNLFALLGGQVLYVSPVLFVAAVLVGRDLWRARKSEDPVVRLLFLSCAVPFFGLSALSLWSRVAEPHWLAPAFLALPLFAAREPRALSRTFVIGSTASGFALTAFVYAWVLIPQSSSLLPDSADPRFDLANELVGWPRATNAIREIVDEERASDPTYAPVLVGPHWTICAQLQASLGRDLPVGCDSPVPDDFDTWLPRDQWRRADEILFVTDSRYPVDLASRFPHSFAVRTWDVPVLRGRRLARTFTLTRLVPRALGEATPPRSEPSSAAPRRG